MKFVIVKFIFANFISAKFLIMKFVITNWLTITEYFLPKDFSQPTYQFICQRSSGLTIIGLDYQENWQTSEQQTWALD